MNYYSQPEIKQQEQEYNQFMGKLGIKCRELQDDFNKLSPATQQKIANEMHQYLRFGAIQELLQNLNSQGC